MYLGHHFVQYLLSYYLYSVEEFICYENPEFSCMFVQDNIFMFQWKLSFFFTYLLCGAESFLRS